jgi:hypothetical protein
MYSETSRHATTATITTTSVWMESPYTQHMNAQFNSNNFINILHFDIDFKPFI